MSLPLTPALEVIPGSRSASHSPEAALLHQDLGLIHITGTMRPNPDTRTGKLPCYENTEMDHYWDY